MKKRLIIFILNLMAFGSIVSSIYNQFGLSFCLRISIPFCLIFATNMACVLKVLSVKKEK